MTPADEEVMAKVLSDERSCRMMLEILIKQGVLIHQNIYTLRHEECIELILAIAAEVKRNDLKRGAKKCLNQKNQQHRLN